MNRKMLMLMANRNQNEKGRRMNIEYEDWGARGGMDAGRSRGGYSNGDMSGGAYSVGDGYSRGGDMRRDYGRSEHDGGDWGPDSKFRDRRGREHYGNGRYAPMSRMGDMPRDWSRYPDAGGYDNPEMNRGYPYYPDYPIYEDRGRERKMNPIGFARDMGGSDATMPKYNEMERMEGGTMSRGYSRSERAPHFDRQMAEEWVSNMENEDGSRGPHWTMEQAKQIMAQRGIDGSPVAFWVALNAMYSDYCKVAKKLGMSTMDFYVCMAEAFLNDKDAVGDGPEKLAAYYEYVVKH